MNLKNISKLSIAALLCSLTVGSVSSASAADYVVENSWGSSSGNFGGLWVLGTRSDQLPVKFDITSNDGGQTFTGTMTYKGEGPIGFRAELIGNNVYFVENRWGGNSAPWHDAGYMLIGYRGNQAVVDLDIVSSDDGETFSGTMTYEGEGPIGFYGEMQ